MSETRKTTLVADAEASPKAHAAVWPTERDRELVAASLRDGLDAARAAYDRANRRLTDRVTAPDPAEQAPPGGAAEPKPQPTGAQGDGGSGADPAKGDTPQETPEQRKARRDAEEDKAILEDAKLTAAAKSALAAMQAAWQAMAQLRPPESDTGRAGGRGAPRQADAESLAESRRRLAGMPHGREGGEEDQP
jgi:hypothetical protein